MDVGRIDEVVEVGTTARSTRRPGETVRLRVSLDEYADPETPLHVPLPPSSTRTAGMRDSSWSSNPAMNRRWTDASVSAAALAGDEAGQLFANPEKE
ncbi:MAG: hypothetical protein GEU88_04805 [Solirubrobacterales bacterium]|nr:hypothetical protein [Solirubrobacterales bacterium]